jgi:hypothetical protein
MGALRLYEHSGSIIGNKGRILMKKLLLTFVTLAVATAFTAPAFATVLNAKNKAECEKAGGVWIEQTNKCGAKKQ